MSKFLQAAQEAIATAEKITLDYYRKRPRVQFKADHSPVTAADRAAERAIVASLRKRFPDHGFFGEEYGRSSSATPEYLWLIDPIDGTKNFVDHIPLWGNLIALWHRGEIILGISNVPLMRERLWAERGKGAFLNGKRVRVSAKRRLSDSMLSFGSLGAFRERRLERRTLQLLHACRRQRSFGDLWPYHLLACGRLEIVIEAAIKPMDVAPFVCIVGEAGGHTTDLAGHPFGLQISSFVGTNGHLHDSVMECLRRKRRA
jgi:histidinol-phosphatase